MKVLVIGGTGYIGSHVATHLLSRGHEVGVFARSEKDGADATTRYAGEVTKYEHIREVVLSYDAIVYAAPPDAESISRLGTCMAYSNKKLIAICGSMIYGDTEERVVSESQPINPPGPLSFLKTYDLAIQSARRLGVQSIVLRVPFLYGDKGGDLPKALVNAAIRRGFPVFIGTGENKWSTIHIDQLVDCVARLLEERSTSGVYNTCSDDTVEMKGLANVLEDLYSLDAPKSIQLAEARQMFGFFAAAFAMNMRLDNKLLKRDIGELVSKEGFADELVKCRIPL